MTASDGKGTNILSSIKGGGIAVGTKVIAPSEAPEPHIEILQPEIAEIPEVVIQLERIIREAVIAEKLPGKPKLTVPLYPDETRWYNKSGDVIVLWELPEDIIQVATRLSHTMDKKSGIKEEELFTGKNFGTLEEGIWYTRIQFKNNIGWGDLAYHKISLDMTAPLPFEIGIDNLLSDNPIPKITFETQDSFSGISHALIFIDNNDPIRSTSTSMMLPPQKPGKHNILVKVFDLAGNSIEDDLEFEVLPLPMPVVDFVTDRVAQGDFIFMSGSSIPDGFVDVRVFEDSQEIFRKTVSSDSLGGWEIVLDEFLPRGEYSLVVNARDSREAISYSSEHIGIRVKAKVVFTLGFIDLGWFEISIIVILLFIATGATIAWYYIKRRETSEAYKIVVSRDIKKISKLIEDNLKEIEYHHENVKTPTAASNTQMNTLISKMKVNVNKMKKYLSKEMEQLK